MARGITENDVFTACDALLLAGERPTIERVRQKIGRGSPNTVSPMLDAWFKGLGRRLQDPGAFAAAPDVPDPVLQAAQHFWQTALALSRADFDARLREGLAAATAFADAEKERADQAGAALADATESVLSLQLQLGEQGRRLDQAQQDLAAERARVEGLHTALDTANERFREQEAKAASDLEDIKRQLAGALERADAADRRVALELERERAARAKAERQADTAHRSLDAAREAAAAASQQAQFQLTAAREREQAQAALYSATLAELEVERARLAEVRAMNQASTADALTARGQVSNLQASLDRLAALVESGSRAQAQGARKRAGKPSTSEGAP